MACTFAREPMNQPMTILDRSSVRAGASRLSLAVLAASLLAPAAAGCVADDRGPSAAQALTAGDPMAGSGSGALPGDGSGSGGIGGGGIGGGGIGGGGTGGGGTGGGGTGGGGTGTQVPSAITGAQITLAYSGHAQYTLPAWNTLPEVQVVEQLMIARFTQPDFNGPVTGHGVSIFLRVVGDPFVDTYVFNFTEGTPGDPWSFQDPSGNWFARSGGAPSQAGPPMTGRPEIIMAQAGATSWTPLTEWAIPELYRPDGWPSMGSATESGLSSSLVALNAAQPAMSTTMISLNAVAGLVALTYGAASLSAFGGGPLCAPATVTCGTSISRVAIVFVAAYITLQAAVSGQKALQAAAAAGVAGGVLAVWRSKLVQDVLAAVVTSAGICAASAVTCGGEAAHFCALTSPVSAIICQQDTRLTAFNGAGIGAAVAIALTGALDLGITLFREFGIGVAN